MAQGKNELSTGNIVALIVGIALLVILILLWKLG